MEQTLSLEFLRVVEEAAIACARSIGHGRRKYSDKLAVEAMRTTMESVRMDGTIVIGEGERDEAPMLYIGEKVGMGMGHPAVDIAVDPLEGTNLCATGAPNAIAVLAATERGGLLHAPDLYMEKLVVGPAAKGKVHLDAPVRENLEIIAKSLDRPVGEITVSVLDRERHTDLVKQIREAGARIQLIGDGDLSAAISAAVSGTGIHCVMGTGGAPEGVLSAAALKCLNGEIQGRLKVDTNTASREKAEAMGVDFTKIYKTEELCPGQHVVFAACGVTRGNLLNGVQFFGHGIRTHSLILTYQSRQVGFMDRIQLHPGENVTVRF
jgi:fructose-1,6-bisphosphatase class II